jgi:large subunit ribosomal protein L13
MKTFTPKSAEIERAWHVVDADNVPVGRVAVEVARLLRGKHKPIYTPHADTGDFVVVVNAEKAVFTGNKEQDKVYYRHSGRPGGLKTINPERLRQRHPERILEYAVKGMLPKNKLGRKIYRKLKVYAGPDHPHQSQQPAPFELKRAVGA